MIKKMTIGCKGIKLMRGSEGCRLTASADTDGVPMIGYGTRGTLADGRKIVFGLTITQAEADAAYEAYMNRRCYQDIYKKIKVDINQNQFDALVDLAYNLGSIPMKLADAINQGKDKQTISDIINSYNHGKVKDKTTGVTTSVVMNGLTKRRAKDVALYFDTSTDNCVPPKPDVASGTTQPPTGTVANTSGQNDIAQVSADNAAVMKRLEEMSSTVTMTPKQATESSFTPKTSGETEKSPTTEHPIEIIRG